MGIKLDISFIYNHLNTQEQWKQQISADLSRQSTQKNCTMTQRQTHKGETKVAKETGQSIKGTTAELEAPDEAKDIQDWNRIL